MQFNVTYINCILFNNILITGCYITSTEIVKKYREEDFLVLNIIYVYKFCSLYMIH